ncbi:MAG: DUF4979 domain-containing protein [Bacteroidaceae bacterium]|nr:DUF4979 domain-containing protein [Bacteroidaceae bacterium]
MNTKINKILAVGLVVCGLMACSEDDERIPDVSAATCPSAIELQIPAEFQKLIYTDNTDAQVLPLIVGEQVQLGYTLQPEDATFQSVVWTSSDESVATVTADGRIEALSERGLGYTIVTVAPTGMYAGSGVLSTLKVKVAAHLQQASEIHLSAATTEVYEGEQTALTYAIEPEATTYRTLAWTSSDESVATVDSKGVVTGVSTGGTATKTVTITGTAMDGSGVSASTTITVKRIVQPQSVSLDQAYSSDNGYAFALNEMGAQLSYTTVPVEATQSQLQWSSSDESIATVEAGYVTFKGFGEVTITATCPETGNSSSLKVNIPVGLLRETFHNPDHYSIYDAKQSGSGTTTGNEWHDGYLTITTYTVNATTQRADLKWWDLPATLHAGNYPIVAIKVDDVKDLYSGEGVTARNLNFDVVGKSESGVDFKALGNGNNKYSGDLKCSDASHVFIYDLAALPFGTGGLAPTNESISFNTFQLKYADIKTIDHQITYNLYWFQTFKTVDDVKKYVTDVDGLSYEVIK